MMRERLDIHVSQADVGALFARYDTERRGSVNVHKLVRRMLPSDFDSAEPHHLVPRSEAEQADTARLKEHLFNLLGSVRTTEGGSLNRQPPPKARPKQPPTPAPSYTGRVAVPATPTAAPVTREVGVDLGVEPGMAMAAPPADPSPPLMPIPAQVPTSATPYAPASAPSRPPATRSPRTPVRKPSSTSVSHFGPIPSPVVWPNPGPASGPTLTAEDIAAARRRKAEIHGEGQVSRRTTQPNPT